MKKIIIIGAGLAGLSAAYHLSKSGNLDITMIDSSGRVGGRVKSVKIDEKYYDMGGFLILPWYKTFINLCKEVGIDNHLVKLKNFNEYYWDIETQSLKELSKIKVPVKDFLAFGLVVIPKLLRNKINFYKPSYDGYGNKSVSDFIKNTNLIHKFNNIVLEAYTYPSLSDYPMSIYLPFMLKMREGYFDKCFVLDGNTELLANKLAESFTANGGKIILNSKVDKIEKNKVHMDNVSLQADKVIVATRLNKKLFPEFFKDQSEIKYTNNYCIYVKLENDANIEGSDKWTFVYVPLEKKEKFNIVSLYNTKGIDDNHDSKNLGIILQTTEVETLDNEKLLEVVREKLNKFLPNNKVEKILVSEHWIETMPYVKDEILNKIDKAQGKNNIYYAGDYLSGTTMEAALYFGKKAAELAIKDPSI
jgi:protoporphyrinogen oxidase